MSYPSSIAIAGATGMVGRPLTRELERRGVRVVPVSRSTGVDVLAGDGLEERLAGVSTVVDVTNSPTPEPAAATGFFVRVAENLGRAAAKQGASRLIVLSILGVHLIPDGYFAAKFAQENAAREAFGDGVTALRAAQFHEFAEQSLAWGRDGDRCVVPDLPVQPVALSEVVRVLADLATAAEAPAVVSLAGPRPESLVDMVRAVARADHDGVEVVPQHVDGPAGNGALRPEPDATLAGPTFAQWLDTRGHAS